MAEPQNLLFFGASTRAAAFSALRAGLRPWCVDLFADRDLRARCQVVAVRGKYPEALLEALRSAPPGPWMYTGGLENHPRLVGQMADLRELWGNDAAALNRARNPLFVADVVGAAGLPIPQVVGSDGAGADRRWLVKPLKCAGGRDFPFWADGQVLDSNHYLQEYIEGTPVAVIFAADGRRAQWLGVTRQLIGESYCHARAFHYCGSVGPLSIGEKLRTELARLGDALTAGCQLRGLFGIDGVLRDDTFWPVEVNPRYTASVEVLEYANGLQALRLHGAAFDATLSAPAMHHGTGRFIGKAILMARENLVFPADGPWDAALRKSPLLDEMPAFADIPEAGERIKAGRPILTLFASGESLVDAEGAVRRAAVDLDRRLFGS